MLLWAALPSFSNLSAEETSRRRARPSRTTYRASGLVQKIYPMPSGGVLVEFVCNGWDLSVEFGSHGEAELFGIEIDGAGELLPIQFAEIGPDLIAQLDKYAGRK